MGLVFKGWGKLDKAIRAHRKAISIEPSYAQAYKNMGTVFHMQGKFEEAIKAYKSYIYFT